MIKYLCLCLLLFYGCGGKKSDPATIRVSVLRGPSAIVFAQWLEHPPMLDNKQIQIKLVDSPDLIQAALINGDTDLAVLPLISAVNLYNKGIQHPLLGCPIWGTLYLVEAGEVDRTESPVLHIFGAGTTPDILTRSYMDAREQKYIPNYSFATAREVMQALFFGKVKTAVLSEPFLSMALRNDSTLHILADLNQPDAASPGFAQSAIICSPALLPIREGLDSLLQSSCHFATSQPAEVIRILESQQVFPVGMLTSAGIERCKINYLPAAKAAPEVLRLLQLILKYEPKAIGGQLPDEGFLTGKL